MTSQNKSGLYADFNASAPLCHDVKNYLLERLQGPFANPNAGHKLGIKIMLGMDKCRRTCAENLGAKPEMIVFNSGSSEGISHILHSILSDGPQNNKDVIITSNIEHSAVSNGCEYYAQRGYTKIIIPSDENGYVCDQLLKQQLEKYRGRVQLVTIMAANNETGVIQPYKKMAQLCQEHQVLFFSDTTQYIGKAPFHFLDSGMDFAVAAAHKLGALTGCGLILAKNKKNLRPFIFGGGQESGLRGGTQNYIGIECMSVAIESLKKKHQFLDKALAHRLYFEKELKKAFPQVAIFGEKAERLASTVFLAYPGVEGSKIQRELEKREIFVTTSSACSDQEIVSKVLQAMGVSASLGNGATRISLCCTQGIESDDPMGAYRAIYEALSFLFSKTN